MNTHGFPDVLKETQSICADLLPVCVISSSGLTTPGSGLTLAGVSAKAYAKRANDLLYIDQPSINLSVPNVAGQHWLIAHVDTHSSVAGWNRVAGSHLLQQQNATQPTMPDACVLLAQITVTGSNISAVSETVALTPPLSRQTADAVAITGGTAVLTTLQTDRLGVAITPPSTLGQSHFNGPVGIGTVPQASMSLAVANNAQFSAPIGLGIAPTSHMIMLLYQRGVAHGIDIRPTADSGPGAAISFENAAGTLQVGSITTTATATSYATSSDRRLKRNVQPLTDALATLRQVRPVSFLWNQDDSAGQGFLADEIQPIIPACVTGMPDEVNVDGSIRPQGIDYGKIVPWLVGAIQELLERVEALEGAILSP